MGLWTYGDEGSVVGDFYYSGRLVLVAFPFWQVVSVMAVVDVMADLTGFQNLAGLVIGHVTTPPCGTASGLKLKVEIVVHAVRIVPAGRHLIGVVASPARTVGI